MKKLLFTIFCITQIGFILVYPTEALKAAREGLNLWLNVMIPTLLPFLICTGILVQTRPDQPVAGTVQNVMEDCFWHISLPVHMQFWSECCAVILWGQKQHRIFMKMDRSQKRKRNIC